MAARETGDQSAGRKPRRRSGCCLGVVVLAAVIVVALLQYGKKAVEARVEKALGDELPAEAWTVKLPSTAVVSAVAGRPFDLIAAGTKVTPKDFPQVATIDVDVRGLRLDTRAKAVRGGTYQVEALIDQAALSTWATTDTNLAKVASDVRISIEPPNVAVEGDVDIGQLTDGVADLGIMRLKAKGKPAIISPTVVGLELDEVGLALPQSLNLGFELPASVPVPAGMKQTLGQLLRLDMTRALPGLRIESAVAETGGLRIRGGGQVPTPGEPKLRT